MIKYAIANSVECGMKGMFTEGPYDTLTEAKIDFPDQNDIIFELDSCSRPKPKMIFLNERWVPFQKLG